MASLQASPATERHDDYAAFEKLSPGFTTECDAGLDLKSATTNNGECSQAMTSHLEIVDCDADKDLALPHCANELSECHGQEGWIPVGSATRSSGREESAEMIDQDFETVKKDKPVQDSAEESDLWEASPTATLDEDTPSVVAPRYMASQQTSSSSPSERSESEDCEREVDGTYDRYADYYGSSYYSENRTPTAMERCRYHLCPWPVSSESKTSLITDQTGWITGWVKPAQLIPSKPKKGQSKSYVSAFLHEVPRRHRQALAQQFWKPPTEAFEFKAVLSPYVDIPTSSTKHRCALAIYDDDPFDIIGIINATAIDMAQTILHMLKFSAPFFAGLPCVAACEQVPVLASAIYIFSVVASRNTSVLSHKTLRKITLTVFETLRKNTGILEAHVDAELPEVVEQLTLK
ncbi:MAG: hypothetical protein Q9168_002674 [Polycauliona sp. 1 TL-2023]